MPTRRQTAAGAEPFRLVRWSPQSGAAKELHVRGFEKLLRPEGIAVRGRALWVVQDLEDVPGEALVVLDPDTYPK